MYTYIIVQICNTQKDNIYIYFFFLYREQSEWEKYGEDTTNGPIGGVIRGIYTSKLPIIKEIV